MAVMGDDGWLMWMWGMAEDDATSPESDVEELDDEVEDEDEDEDIQKQPTNREGTGRKEEKGGVVCPVTDSSVHSKDSTVSTMS